MFHDVHTIPVDDGFQSDSVNPETGPLRRVIDYVVTALLAMPSEAEIAAQREYRRLMEEAWEKINRTTPAYIRGRME